MIFSEIYSCYYLTISEIIKCAIEGKLDDAALNEIAENTAFQDSAYHIRSIMKNDSEKEEKARDQDEVLMPLLFQETFDDIERPITKKTAVSWRTPIVHVPNLPLTLLEKRWMKALLSDPKMKLFDIDVKGLDDIEPLFAPDTFIYYDCNLVGDPYEDPTYISNFRIILKALHEERNLWIVFQTRSGDIISEIFTPHHLEYSEKDDCFRLYAASQKWSRVIPLANIKEIKSDDSAVRYVWMDSRRKELTLLLQENSKRNVLERFMIGFSYFEKEARRLNQTQFQIKIRYDADEEKDVLIQLLSFGPYLKVTAPEKIVLSIRSRLEKQLKLMKNDDHSK